MSDLCPACGSIVGPFTTSTGAGRLTFECVPQPRNCAPDPFAHIDFGLPAQCRGGSRVVQCDRLDLAGPRVLVQGRDGMPIASDIS